jgi:hypothetical protein
MELRARIQPLPRRAAMMAACVALLVTALAAAILPATADAKKKRKAPVVTKVSPLDVAVGEKLTIRGRHFIRGRYKNTVVFKRDGARAVFVKARIGTKKMLSVTVPDSLQEYFSLNAGTPVPTRFRLRVLSRKFAKKYTSEKISPIVSAPRPPREEKPAEALPDGDCDGDGTKNRADGDDDNDGLADDVELSLSLDPCKADSDGDGLIDRWEFDCDRDTVLNRDETDDDNDLLPDDEETRIGTDPCSLDTDGDTVEDGYEYRSARDLNDDLYQTPNGYLPYPWKTPYPNALYADAHLDYDGDNLSLGDEQALWRYTTARWAPRSLEQLTYSDGKKYTRSISAVSYQQAPAAETEAEHSLHKQYVFLRTATAQGYPAASLLNMNGRRMAWEPEWALTPSTWLARDNVVSDLERYYFDEDHNGWLRDDELDEDGDGLSNWDEAHGYMQPTWWKAWYGLEGTYVIPYAGTKLDDADSDGDTIIDGADDQDHDDIPNVQELSRRLVAGESADDPAWSVGDSPAGINWNRPLENPKNPPTPANPDPARGHVNPFNPCLPDPYSRTCPERVPADAWAPFNLKAEQIYYVFN